MFSHAFSIDWGFCGKGLMLSDIACRKKKKKSKEFKTPLTFRLQRADNAPAKTVSSHARTVLGTKRFGKWVSTYSEFCKGVKGRTLRNIS